MSKLALVVFTAACATTTTSTPRGGPRGLRASEHLSAAQQHEEVARQQQRWPETRADVTGHAPDTAGVPWLRSWDSTDDHERLAAIHRGKAGELQAEYEEACGTRSIDEIATSPIARYGIGGWPTATGVILYLSPDAGPPDRLLADLRCHRAWMMLAPADMDDCPLDLPGLALDARGDTDGITVSIIVRDPALVTELHRRATHELETAGHHHVH